jgi:hypothetical protein
MKTNTYALIVAGALALVGCSSVKTQVDTGPIQARTFSFINAGTRQVPTYAERRNKAHEAVHEAITKNLAAKGVSKVSQSGDITVAYLIIVGNNATTTSLNEYFGYTSEANALTDKAHNAQAVKKNDRGYIESGTLVIDILDSKTSNLLKRATIQAQILRDLPLDAREKRLQALVDEALSDLRISQ